MIALVYAVHPRIDAQTNAAAHLARLARAIDDCGAGVAITFLAHSQAELRRFLVRTPLHLLYVLAHSGAAGMQFLDGSRMTAADWAEAWRVSPQVPRSVWLATCDGVGCGLAQAALEAGAETVIAADGPVAVGPMCRLSEKAITVWAQNGAFAADHLCGVTSPAAFGVCR